MCPRDVALAMSPEIICRFRRRLYRWESRKRYETEEVSKYVATKWCRCRPPLVVTNFSRVLWKIAVADQWRTSSLPRGGLSQFLFRWSKLYPCRSSRPAPPRALSSFIDLVLATYRVYPLEPLRPRPAKPTSSLFSSDGRARPDTGLRELGGGGGGGGGGRAEQALATPLNQ